MSKRAEYSDETKAQVMAALLTGQAVAAVAKAYKIPEGTIKSWRQRKAPKLAMGASQKTQIDDLLLGYLGASLLALKAQAEFFQDAEWLRKQEASQLAVLHGVLADKAIRLLEAHATAIAPDEGD